MKSSNTLVIAQIQIAKIKRNSALFECIRRQNDTILDKCIEYWKEREKANNECRRWLIKSLNIRIAEEKKVMN